MHNWPALPAGTIGLNAGPMMAAADRIEIVVSGRGGHGAHPYLAVDPVLVAAHIITAAQSIVSRNVSPIDSAVVSLCAMQAGDLGAFSVIPREATLIGTVRTFQPRGAGHDRGAPVATWWSRSRVGFGATAHAELRAHLSGHDQHAGAGDVRRRRGRVAGRRGQRGARPAAEHGRRGLLLHAAGEARRLRAPRAGRRGRLLPAQHAATTSTTRCCRWAPRCSQRWSSARCRSPNADDHPRRTTMMRSDPPIAAGWRWRLACGAGARPPTLARRQPGRRACRWTRTR